MMTMALCFSVRFQVDQYNRLKNDTSKAVGEKKKVKFNKLCMIFV